MAIAAVAIPTLCCTYWIGIVSVRARSHDIAIQRLSAQLNIPPTWDAFEGYLSENLELGISKEQAYIEFEKISPYVIKPSGTKGCEVVKFKPGILNISSYELYTCYDAASKLKYFDNDDP
ncbi:MAG: hypothetical protein AAF485_32150 [Chloroflexota bacterium]